MPHVPPTTPLPSSTNILSTSRYNVLMDPQVTYLLSLNAVRDRAKLVGEAAEAGKLSNFDVHEERLSDVADFVTSIIKVHAPLAFSDIEG
jgi:hypothetical protein